MIGFPLAVYRVKGQSMLPHYRPGDIVVGWRWSRAQPGQVVVARVDGRAVIKRLHKLEAGKLWLTGDNPAASTDSRQWGSLPPASFQARIIAKIPAQR